MIIDDVLVFRAELDGLRLLSNLSRPKVPFRPEDVPGAFCLWGPAAAEGNHRYEVRLTPDSDEPLDSVLRAIQKSSLRPPGGHLQIRGVARSFDSNTRSLLVSLGGRRIVNGPYAMMARDLRTNGETTGLPAGLSATVADNAERLTQLRSLVRQVYVNQGAAEAAAGDDAADFFHAPGIMAYLAVSENGQVVSTGSFLIVGHVANIWSVATLPTARGRGAASAITRAACAEASRQEAHVAALRTTNDLAQAGGLYHSVGFEIVGSEHVWNLDNIDDLDLDLGTRSSIP